MAALFAVSFHANTSVQSGKSSHDQFTLSRRGSGERLLMWTPLHESAAAMLTGHPKQEEEHLR
jgi:hypothetical protein